MEELVEEDEPGERLGERLHEVARTGLDEVVDEPVDEGPDGGLVLGDDGGREVGVDEPLVLTVEWRVDLLGQRRHPRLPERHRDPVGGAERLPVLRHPDHVLVAADQPEAAVLLAARDRMVGAHAGHRGVQVPTELGRHVVEAMGAPLVVEVDDVAVRSRCRHGDALRLLQPRVGAVRPLSAAS